MTGPLAKNLKISYAGDMFYLTVGVILLILIIAGFLHGFGEILGEDGTSFLYIAGIALFLILGAGVYLSYAVPSLAGSHPKITGSQAQTAITQDTPQGFPADNN